jgi:integrase
MSRRGQGEGSIYRRVDGRWAAAVDLGWRDGKRVRKSLYGKTRKEVADKLAKTLRELQQGITPADDRVTVADWVARHLDDLEARKAASHGTLKRYRGLLVNYIEPAIGRRRLAQLQPQQIQAYQSDLLRRGMSSSTITVHRALLSGAINEAVAFGLIPRNVVRLVKPPKDDDEAKGKALTAEHARAMLAAAIDDPLYVFYLLLLTAGLRRGEALGLSWQDIELPDDTNSEHEHRPAILHVRQQLQWPDGVATLVPLKSKRSKRTIPVPSRTALALKARRVRQYEQLGCAVAWNNLVLTTPKGGPVHRNTIVKQFHAVRKRAELPYYRPHDLRHTYGSLLMSQGVPLKTISELLGHASIEVTADVYLHSMEGQVLDTAKAIDRALDAPAWQPGIVAVNGVCPTCGKPS